MNNQSSQQNTAGQIDKLPPQEPEAERCLLGCLMLDKEAIVKVVDFLQPRDFYKQTHQEIYQAMVELFDRKEPIDLLTVSTRLKENKQLSEIGGNAYLTEMINSVPTASHILNYAKIVQRKRILRDLISTSHEINQIAYDESKDTDELLDEAEKRIFGIAQGSLAQRFRPVKESLEDAFERLDKLSKGEGMTRGVPTGFIDLDSKLSGLQKADFIILAGRPSLGKSAMALDFARNAALQHGETVGIFSLEMSQDQIVDRLIAAQANVDLWRLRTGRLSGEGENNDFARIRHALDILSKAPIFIDDAATSNILQMRAMARRLQADKGLGLLIIDYIQLMEPRDPRKGEVQQITEISRALKGLARELNVPVLALSQLSRAVEQRTPQIPRLSDLRQSGCLAGDTLIMRADTGERIPIKKLVSQTDIPVYSLDEDWKIKIMEISKVFSSGKKMVYELKTRSGKTIKASANHPFRKIDGWHQLKQLKVGDFIATPKKLSTSRPKNELSKDEIILLAHLLGDGCVLPHQPVHYTSGDLENIKIVAESAKRLFQIKPRVVQQKTWWHIYLPSPYPTARGKYHPITNWYKKLGIKRVRSWNKEIPQKVFGLNENNICLFLKHLWSTDGNISVKLLKGRRPNGNIYYATTSPKLAESIKHLLLRCGIRSKVSGVRKGNYRICYHVHIQGKEHQLRFLGKIGSFGERGKIIPQLLNYLREIEANTNLDVWPKESWQFFIFPIIEEKEISWQALSAGINTQYGGVNTLVRNGIGLKRLNRIATFLQSQELSNLVKSDIFWDKIISIESLGVEKVYDATVPGAHNFIANDIILHNSLEQDSDVVLFISREDRYKPDTPRKNIADIIIAKHRNGPIGKIELYFDEQRVTFRNLEKRQLDQ